MKLSICIPVYNFNVNELVDDLLYEVSLHHLDAEIILIDDASDKEFLDQNKNLETKVKQFILLEENIGRSRIRNLFLNYCEADYLLFLDCDGKIIRENFLKIYYDFINNYKPDVVFGGRKVSDMMQDLNHGLRWKFAVEREDLPLDVRLKLPYSSFQTNNFIVRKEVLIENPFNNEITQYGYEDLVFAKDLCNNHIKVDHIDNPIFNNDVETNSVFLSKADQSAKSLAQLLHKENELDRVSQIRLAKAYIFMKKTRTVFIFNLIYKISKSTIQKKLLKGDGSLNLLNFYKLGQLIGYMNKD